MRKLIIIASVFGFIYSLFFAWDMQLAQTSAWEVPQELEGHPHG